ncbi:hypothetical protein BLNAU_21822 [Blattamonas nauphoetae]|uniref:Uncharacterized protein n=1 Tax=Blattamonas nauphoetae TaxID=2049346 RepID=A0ABQ9WUT6_9EUKA|nr:hypothetical protein BLNAU_21822 [Blattamonas nauphoetae]
MAFQNTVNDWQKELNFKLIERLKTLLENQHAEAQPGVVVDVFFVWIVRPHLVEHFVKQTVVFPDSAQSRHKWKFGKYRSRVSLPCNAGVVSIADLLFSVPSALDDARLADPNVEVKWETDSPEFRDCFVIQRDQTVGSDAKLEMEVPVSDNRDASTNDGEADDLREGEEEEA